MQLRDDQIFSIKELNLYSFFLNAFLAEKTTPRVHDSGCKQRCVEPELRTRNAEREPPWGRRDRGCASVAFDSPTTLTPGPKSPLWGGTPGLLPLPLLIKSDYFSFFSNHFTVGLMVVFFFFSVSSRHFAWFRLRFREGGSSKNILGGFLLFHPRDLLEWRWILLSFYWVFCH